MSFLKRTCKNDIILKFMKIFRKLKCCFFQTIYTEICFFHMNEDQNNNTFLHLNFIYCASWSHTDDVMEAVPTLIAGGFLFDYGVRRAHGRLAERMPSALLHLNFLLQLREGTRLRTTKYTFVNKCLKSVGQN